MMNKILVIEDNKAMLKMLKEILTEKGYQVEGAKDSSTADLLLKNQVAFLTDQGLNYDLVIEIDNKLLRCQVKTTQKMRMITKKSKPIYFFHIKRVGKDGNRQYEFRNN